MRAVTIEDMRNSLLPIILIILTTGGAWWLIRGGAERGAGGPDVAAGILRLPQKTSQQTSPADITGTTTITGDAPADSATWRVILISGDDRHPLTNSAVLALGEELTRRGCIAMLEPLLRDRQEPLPLGCDGALRLSLIESELPTDRPGAMSCTLRINATPTRVPADHPAARWFPHLPASSPTTMTLVHQSVPVGTPSWPHWYAGLGNAFSQAVITHLGTPATTTDTTLRLRRTAWLDGGKAGPETTGPTTTIYGRIPSPPQGDITERRVAFQHPLVRGWIGDFSPVPFTARDQTERPARAELLHRIERGGWRKGPDLGDAVVYSKEDRASDGSDIHRTISITATGFIEWQERPHPMAVWQAWTTAAAAGDAEAAVQLAEHRNLKGIGLP